MIGLRTGHRVGPVVGGAIGIGADQLGGANPLASVTRDATSGKYRPRSIAQWNTTLTVAGISALTPLFGWNCQVASGNILDLFGGGIAGVVGGTLAYQQAVTGWSAQCVQTTDNTTGWARAANAAIPDIGTTSLMLLAHILFPASSGGDRTMLQMGAAFGTRVAMDSDGSNRIVGISSPNSVNGSTANWGTVRPVFLLINRSASIARIGTNNEVLSPVLAADPTGQELVFGGDFSDTWNPNGCGIIDLWGFTGNATQAMAKSMMQTLGWTVAF